MSDTSNLSVIDQITSAFYHQDELSQIVLPINTNVVCNACDEHAPVEEKLNLLILIGLIVT